MDIHDVRRELRTKSIYEIPLRVTYYARVSSESDEQLNSLGNQIKYYEDFIRRNAAWEFVPGYIDEGLSGISTKRRENFNRMVDDASHDKFDLVITKEISRFARNTLDSIRYTRELLSDGVGVFFQNDNINTLDEDSELRLSIMSSIAQDELRKLSSRVKFGHQQAIKSSVVLGNSRIFGYRKDNKRLVIDEEQAPMVRELFELYATDEYSMKQLETLFWNKGYRNLNGKKIAHSTMSNMIANPKYKGYYVGNKVKVVDKRDAQRGKETLAAVGRAHLGGGNVHGHEGRDAVVEEGVAYAADSHEHIEDNYTAADLYHRDADQRDRQRDAHEPEGGLVAPAVSADPAPDYLRQEERDNDLRHEQRGAAGGRHLENRLGEIDEEAGAEHGVGRGQQAGE